MVRIHRPSRSSAATAVAGGAGADFCVFGVRCLSGFGLRRSLIALIWALRFPAEGGPGAAATAGAVAVCRLAAAFVLAVAFGLGRGLDGGTFLL